MNAYVLVQTEGEGEPIAARLQEINGVLSAEDLTGAYDAIAVTQAASTRQLVEHVIAEILKLPGVTRALPAPVIRSLRSAPRSNGQRRFPARETKRPEQLASYPSPYVGRFLAASQEHLTPLTASVPTMGPKRRKGRRGEENEDGWERSDTE